MKELQIIGCMAIVTISLMADHAFADHPKGDGPPFGYAKGHQPRGAPAPMIGVGLPMLGTTLLGFWLVRRLVRKD